MKIFLATDHAGFELKETIKQFLLNKGYDVTDCGALTYEPNDDYPDLIQKAAKNVSHNGGFGIIFGKSGTGEAIVANKFLGVRSVVGFNEENVRLAREHNDANILSLGSAFVSKPTAEALTMLFLNTKFSNEERHIRRIEKITKIEHDRP